MSLSETKWQGVIVGTAVGTATALITNAASTTTLATHMVLYNQHTSSVKVDIFAVDDSGGAVGTADEAGADSNKIITLLIESDSQAILGSSDFKVLLLDENDTLKAYAGTANVVNYYITGFTR